MKIENKIYCHECHCEIKLGDEDAVKYECDLYGRVDDEKSN